MSDSYVSLTTELPVEALEQIDLFRIKFRELWNNWESLNKQGLSLGGHFQNEEKGRVSGPGCGVEVHRLKGFYLDFRFFWAEKEPTSFLKVVALLGKHCDDQRLHRCLKSVRSEWKDAGFLHEWHGIKPDEMIDVLFNGELFHTVPQKRKRMREVQALMADDLAHHCLVFSVYRRMLAVRNVNWVIQPLGPGSQKLRLPADFAQQVLSPDAQDVSPLSRAPGSGRG